MRKNYYYLVAGLPELAANRKDLPVPLIDVFREFEEEVTEEDRELIRFFRYQYDHKNLINLLPVDLKKTEDEDRQKFDDKGFFSFEELKEEIKTPDRLPAYIKDFLEAHQSGTLPFPQMTKEDNLFYYYFQQIYTLGNEFLINWFEFNTDLKNVLAGFNVRRLTELGLAGDDFKPENFLLPVNEKIQTILKSSAPDFSLSSELPWVEKLAAYQKNISDLTGYENLIDEIRWEKAQELSLLNNFTVEVLMTYLIKLSIVERWNQLDEQKGESRFHDLVSSFAENRIPAAEY